MFAGMLQRNWITVHLINDLPMKIQSTVCSDIAAYRSCIKLPEAMLSEDSALANAALCTDISCCPESNITTFRVRL